MGEKFSVNNPGHRHRRVNTSASFEPGAIGLHAAFGTFSRSGSGNGPFGFGWKLSLPSITRKTDKGLPQYRDGDESDVFILAVLEDLVPILDANGARVRSLRTIHGTTVSSLPIPSSD